MMSCWPWEYICSSAHPGAETELQMGAHKTHTGACKAQRSLLLALRLGAQDQLLAGPLAVEDPAWFTDGISLPCPHMEESRLWDLLYQGPDSTSGPHPQCLINSLADPPTHPTPPPWVWESTCGYGDTRSVQSINPGFTQDRDGILFSWHLK